MSEKHLAFAASPEVLFLDIPFYRTFLPPRRLDTCLLMPFKPKHRHRKGLVTDVSGPQRNACPSTLRLRPLRATVYPSYLQWFAADHLVPDAFGTFDPSINSVQPVSCAFSIR